MSRLEFQSCWMIKYRPWPLTPLAAGLSLDVTSDRRSAPLTPPGKPRRQRQLDQRGGPAIKDLIVARVQHTSLSAMCAIGGDAVIPFYRLPILADRPDSLARGETLTLRTSGGATSERLTPTVAALRSNLTLSDDFYGSSSSPEILQGHSRHLPDHPVGRLVETPEEMSAVIDAFWPPTGY